ncbi:retrotransposon protein, putative, ty1-copia subclass [Tanacetum coccineum]
MPLSTYSNLGLGELAYTRLTIEMADRTIKHPRGIAENVLVELDLAVKKSTIWYTLKKKCVELMALPVLNINHSAFRSMFEREKLSGTNFNDWFRSLKLVLRVEKKLFVIEQPLPAAPAADSEAMRKGLPKKAATLQVMAIQGGRIQKAIKKSLNAKGKVKGKGKGKDKPVYILKPKNLKSSAKEHPVKDDAGHHCKKVGHCKRNSPAYLYELIKKKNQVGTASSSDRGGEYISHEFKDYLKACEIVQQPTPPYTPQQNRVSEKRNHTLSDIVRSMMNLTTLPLSFWNYALESATRILNMVPTKKVDKTLYELWYGKVLNLS